MGTLTVHRSAHADVLAAGLADLLAEPPDDPFTPDVVAVPARGVERWLAQRLSHRLGAGAGGDGVCANVLFPAPGRVLDQAVASASARHAEAVARWDPQTAVWPLIDVIDASLREDWCSTLAHHLSVDDVDRGRRVATALRLSRRFEAYGHARPAMLRAWAAGVDGTGREGQDLPDDLRWQAELWRRLREHLGVLAPAELLDDACARLRRPGSVPDLPQRISVFGASRLSPARIAVLSALAEHRDIHLWLHHPSPALWAAVDGAPVTFRRAEDRVRSELRNPLLASMSRDLLELQHLLRRQAPEAVTQLHPGPERPGTLLGRLQADLADDVLPADPPALAAGDRSVQVHACHGRTRQVEVLREAVLGLLADDPTLEPRDVLVMCPDVETFAPLIAAAFGLGADGEADGPHPAARLRVRLADRSLQQTNALLDVLSRVLDLGTARITAPEVLDLAGLAAVRRRFELDDEDLERLTGWVVGTGVRWGLDRTHRQGWQLGDLAQGTWAAGLDRLLTGAALEGEESLFGDGEHRTVPLDDVDSADIDLAGRFAELLDRVAAAQELMSGRHTVHAWLTGLQDATLALAAAGRDRWPEIQLRTVIGDALEAAAGSEALLGPADVRALLADELAGRPTRSSFRTGTLTVCTLVPMRSVPHRVICLLGLDDGTFPRQSGHDGDDALLREPWVGERDSRSEDRQLMLDAVCAAGEHLLITYSGADERTGAPIPPAVPLGELLDALDRTATPPPGHARIRDAVVLRHPLQPFDGRNFISHNGSRPFSFDPLGLAAARAARGPRAPGAPFLAGPLPTRPAADVDLDDLRRLLEHPVRAFLRQRLEVATTRRDDDPDDALPIELEGLETWAIGDRLLTLRLAGLDAARCVELERRRGDLPPGALGARVLRRVGTTVDLLVTASARERSTPPQAQDVDVRLDDGTRVTGTVAGVHGDAVLSVTYSSLAAKHRLSAWLDLVALTASRPRPWRSVVVGRRGRNGVARREFAPVGHDLARRVLHDLVALHRSGLDEPLPMPLRTAAAYADRRRSGTTVENARAFADRDWADGQRFPGEQSDAEHQLVHGGRVALDVLLDLPPGPQESGPGWAADEGDRFGRLSLRVWTDLLAHERNDDR